MAECQQDRERSFNHSWDGPGFHSSCGWQWRIKMVGAGEQASLMLPPLPRFPAPKHNFVLAPMHYNVKEDLWNKLSGHDA